MIAVVFRHVKTERDMMTLQEMFYAIQKKTLYPRIKLCKEIPMHSVTMRNIANGKNVKPLSRMKLELYYEKLFKEKIKTT